ncbi:MAG: FHA domain-containing protein [Proteobacteria bacterium]|nr:FHA domain-containing protein [Pseudomonadota bacterium]
MITIKVIDSRGDKKEYDFMSTEVISVGRDPGCTIRVDESESTVSRIQIQIEYSNGVYTLKNVGKNPVKVNGSEVINIRLNDLDEITVGNVKIAVAISQEVGEQTEGISMKTTEAAESEETILGGFKQHEEKETMPGGFKQHEEEETMLGGVGVYGPGEDIVFTERKAYELPSIIYVKIYENDIFQAAYKLEQGLELKVGRAKGNNILLDNKEISRDLFIIKYLPDGIDVNYVGRSFVNFAGRDLPPGNNCTEQINLGEEIRVSSYRLVISDNNKADAEAILFAKPAEIQTEQLTPESFAQEWAESDGSRQYIEISETFLQKVMKKAKIVTILSLLRDKKKLVTFLLSLWEKKRLATIVSSLAVLIIIVSVFVGYRFIFSVGGKAFSGKYSVAEIKRVNFSDTFESPGIINFLNPIPIMSEIEGVVEDLGFKDGDMVNKGQLLLKIKNNTIQQQIQQAKIELLNAETNYSRVMEYENREEGKSPEIIEAKRALNEAENNFIRVKNKKERVNRLVGKGIMAKNEIETAEAEYRGVENQVKGLQDKLDALLKSLHATKQVAQLNFKKAQAVLNELEANFAKSEIKASVTGIVTFPVVTSGGKNVIVKGQTAPSRIVLAYLGDFDNVGLKIEAPEAEIRKIIVGQPVKITTDIIKDREIIGIVSEVALGATIKENTSVFEVKIKIQADEELKKALRIGASASASIIMNEKQNVLAVPASSVFYFENKPAILYLDGKNNINFTTITVGQANKDNVEVIDSKIPEGTRVITSDPEDIFESQIKRGKVILH